MLPIWIRKCNVHTVRNSQRHSCALPQQEGEGEEECPEVEVSAFSLCFGLGSCESVTSPERDVMYFFNKGEAKSLP